MAQQSPQGTAPDVVSTEGKGREQDKAPGWWISPVIGLGVQHAATPAEVRQIQLVNGTNAIGMMSAVLCALLYALLDFGYLLPLLGVLGGMFGLGALPALLNRSGRGELAKHALLLNFSGSTFVIGAWFLGPRPGVHFLLLLFPGFAVLLWPRRRSGTIAGYIVLELGLYLWIEYAVQPGGVFLPGIPASDVATLRVLSLLTGVLSMAAVLGYGIDVMDRSEAELRLRAEGLQRSNDQLATALGEVRTLQGILPICSYCK